MLVTGIHINVLTDLCVCFAVCIYIYIYIGKCLGFARTRNDDGRRIIIIMIINIIIIINIIKP